MSDFEDLTNSQRELDEKLEQIAAVAHHGALIGFADEHACLNEIRRLSLRWWDMAECSRLQVEQEYHDTLDDKAEEASTAQDRTGGIMSSAEEQEVYHIQKKPKPKGRRHSGEAAGKTLTVRFKSREQYERVCRHAEAQGISINEWCVEQLLKGLEQSE